MDKLDRLGWAAGICVDAYGIGIGVRTTSGDPAVVDELRRLLPPGSEPRSNPTVDVMYSLVEGTIVGQGRRDYHLLYMDSTRIARTMERREVQGRLQLGIRLVVANSTLTHVFVAGAAVGYRGRAIVLLGLDQEARTSLVAALIQSGCTYMSTEYAPIGRARAFVAPFAAPLIIRGAPGEDGRYCSAEELAWPVEREELPLGLLVMGRHAAGKGSKLRRVCRERALLGLMVQAIAARRDPALAIDVLDRTLDDASSIQMRFGDASDAAEQLLSQVQRARAYA